MLISVKCECNLAVMNYTIYISISIFIYICCISVCYVKSFAVINVKSSFYFSFTILKLAVMLEPVKFLFPSNGFRTTVPTPLQRFRHKKRFQTGWIHSFPFNVAVNLRGLTCFQCNPDQRWILLHLLCLQL